MRRLVIVLVALVLTGCSGSSDPHPIRHTAQQIQQRLKAERDRIRARVQQVLAEIQQAIPEATQTSPQVQSRGRTGSTTIDQFLDGVLTSVDDYWTKTFEHNGLRAPS